MKDFQKNFKPLILVILGVLFLTTRDILVNLASNKIERETQILLGNVYGIILTIGLLSVLVYFVWLQWQRQNKHSIESLAPLKPVTINELRKDFGKGGTVNWIDRNVTNVNQLRPSGRVVITGKMKLGKTREAVELIQKAIDSELITDNCIYRPNTMFFSSNQKISFLQLNIEPEHPILLFVDDLPYHFTGNNLESLGELLDELKACKDLFVIATARTDQISEEHTAWLTSKNFYIAEISNLDKVQTSRFVDIASEVYGLQIDNDARSVFINKRDGTPELILMEMRKLGNEGIKHVTGKVAQNIAEDSVVAAWLETKRYIEKQRPYAKYLFDALAMFYSARLPANTYLVLLYANELWKADKTGKQSRQPITKLHQTLKYLEQFEIANKNETISHSDFVAESTIEVGDAQRLLGVFLLNHRRIFRNSILRHFYNQSNAQAIALLNIT